MTALHTLSARSIATGIAQGFFTVEAVARACLDHIETLEPTLHAWAHLNPAQALAQARLMDALGASGPLAGVPLGVKDLIDTADMPTSYGSAMYAGHQPVVDAACVAAARAAGALMLGKTVTTEFAYFTPGPTRNPHSSADAPHTPGGSSSGSAAAVASGMVPVAFGTQTAGSILRPAAYCGVVGYKPSLGTLPVAGVKSLSPSMDTLGVLARSVDDAAFVMGGLTGHALELQPYSGLRVGICLTPHWARASEDSRQAMADAASALSRCGAQVKGLTLPPLMDGVADAQKRIMSHEMAAAFAPEIARHTANPAQGYSAAFAALMDTGRAITATELAQAQALTWQARHAMATLWDDVDVLIAPSTEGAAPATLAATGDPIFNRLWSLLGNPCVQVPVRRNAQGLPLGVTVVGPMWNDALVLSAAAMLEAGLVGA